MRVQNVLLVAVIAAGFAAVAPVRAQNNPFLGAWNLTGDPPNTGNIYWLEVKEDGGKPSAMFLNRGGSPVAATNVTIANGELTFTIAGDNPKNVVSLKESGGKLTGTVGATPVKVTGVRPPTWGACDANAAHTFGKPVVLFDGKSMDAWGVQDKAKPMGWAVEDGAMTNTPPANNLVSKETFKDFRDRRGVQVVAQRQQRHLPARPLRDAGAGRCGGSAGGRARAHVDLFAQGAGQERQQAGR